jgi:hypothetical protein
MKNESKTKVEGQRKAGPGQLCSVKNDDQKVANHSALAREQPKKFQKHRSRTRN